LWADALGVTLEEFDDLLRIDQEHDVDRREFVQRAGATMAGAAFATAAGAAEFVVPGAGGDAGWLTALTRGSPRLGADDVRRLVERTAQLRRLDDVLGGSATMQLYASEAKLTQRLIGGTSHSAATRRALMGIYAEQVQQAGWAAFDAGDSDGAARLFSDSLAAAEEANDQALAGNSLAFLAYQRAFLLSPDVALAEASYERAKSSAPGRVQALLLERLAFTYAVAGNVSETERALDLARASLVAATGPQAPDWVFWVDATEVDIMAGRCWSQLRRPLRAIPLLSTALAGFDDSHARDKALYLSWLASSYADAGEPEQAAAVTNRVIDLAAGVASERPWSRIIEVGQQLRPYRSVVDVGAVLERVETEAPGGRSVL